MKEPEGTARIICRSTAPSTNMSMAQMLRHIRITLGQGHILKFGKSVEDVGREHSQGIVR